MSPRFFHPRAPGGPLNPPGPLRERLLAASDPSEIAGLLIQGARYDLSQAPERERLANAFTCAAAFGNLPAMEQMLEAGADPDWPAPRPSARTALIYALLHGEEEAALWLLERGASPGQSSHELDTPLMISAAFGRLRSLAELFERGADLEAIDSRGRTALRRAVDGFQIEAAAALLRLGANPLALALDGRTPFDAARSEDMAALLAASLERQALLQSTPDPAPAPDPPKPRL